MYKKLILLMFLPLTVVLITGCGGIVRTVHYGNANYGSGSKYLAKPLYVDTVKNNKAATYVSGQYFNNSGKGYYNDELSRFGDFLIHRVHSEKYHNLSYGLIGYYGNYYVNELTDFKGNKSFYGGGVTGSFDVRYPIHKSEWRIIGIQTTFLFEDGEYASFKKEADGAENLYSRGKQVIFNNIHPDNRIINRNINTEFIYNFDKISLGLYFSVGSIRGIRGERQTISIGTGVLNLLFNQTNTTFYIQSIAYANVRYMSVGISQRIF